MNITFVIGNGFDLACGLKTRYTDAYKEYCNTKSPNRNIALFKAEILKDNYENWTDFEMALPAWGITLGDFKKFEECVLDFTGFLNYYLQRQEDLIYIEKNNQALAQKLRKDFYQFYDYCLQASKSTLQSLIYDQNEDVICNFITFNYTQTLEKCLRSLGSRIEKKGSFSYLHKAPLHIHGTLNNGLILGLDNETLYQDIPCDDIRRLRNLIDKLHINNRSSNITQAVSNVLEKSRVIVILGWSMGESDSYWVNNLRNLFSQNSKLHLVYVPYFCEPLNKVYRNEQLNREDIQKDFIATKFGVPEAQRNRIHIITDDNYMKLDFLVNNSNNMQELVTT